MLEQSAKLQPGPRVAVSGASFFGTEGLIDLLEAPEAQEASKLTLMDHPSATGQRCVTQSTDHCSAGCTNCSSLADTPPAAAAPVELSRILLGWWQAGCAAYIKTGQRPAAMVDQQMTGTC